eukprot:TRINITY_DN76762_c0_g1_i1.p1 TRINITY_DN76762_c0_g1~~TRINITY_DN76762_c0_g1_i1.p1  ORF type:complete len:408 (-),score=21.56 TRINITY_DN76762_c0_g1_i1:121-1221(-)
MSDEEVTYDFGKKKKRVKDQPKHEHLKQTCGKYGERGRDSVIEQHRPAVGHPAVISESETRSSCESDSSSSSSSSCSGSTNARTESETSKPPKIGSAQGSVSDTQASPGTKASPRCKYAARVLLWTEQVPIGFGLCPWAGYSHNRGHLRCVTCEGHMPSDVAQLVLAEAEMLKGTEVAPWSTTLVVCPYVETWNNFSVFEDWVDCGIWDDLRGVNLDQHITLVSFHPEFLRWRGLPDGVGLGSVVQSYSGMPGRKSTHTAPATIIEIGCSMFGLRKVRVRFHDDMREQYVPIEWLAYSVSRVGPPLPDNAMHRAPHPTVHIIRNADLGTLCMREVSRVKRRNANRMMKLGWAGVQKAAERHHGVRA